MIKKLYQIIKQAVIKSTDDTTAYPRGQAYFNGKLSSYMRLSPYGLNTNPPDDAWVLLFNVNGQESAKVGIADDILNRFKNLAKGEAALYNTLTKSYVLLKANGDIVAVSTNDIDVSAAGDIKAAAGGNIEAEATGTATVTAPSIVLNGNVTINGAITQIGGGAVSFSGSVSSLIDFLVGAISAKNHLHGGVTTGSGTTGAPQ